MVGDLSVVGGFVIRLKKHVNVLRHYLIIKDFNTFMYDHTTI